MVWRIAWKDAVALRTEMAVGIEVASSLGLGASPIPQVVTANVGTCVQMD